MKISVAMMLLAIAIAVSACANRPMHVDLDAIVVSNSVTPVNGITSAGQPDRAALEVFAASGYEAVIDLRGANEKRGIEEATAVKDLGMTYVNFPVEGRDAINYKNAAELDRLIASFDGPVLVHCGSGNRVAALLALSKSAQGADDETALEYGRQAGLTRLEGVVRERLEDKEKAP